MGRVSCLGTSQNAKHSCQPHLCKITDCIIVLPDALLAFRSLVNVHRSVRLQTNGVCEAGNRLGMSLAAKESKAGGYVEGWYGG